MMDTWWPEKPPQGKSHKEMGHQHRQQGPTSVPAFLSHSSNNSMYCDNAEAIRCQKLAEQKQKGVYVLPVNERSRRTDNDWNTEHLGSPVNSPVEAQMQYWRESPSRNALQQDRVLTVSPYRRLLSEGAAGQPQWMGQYAESAFSPPPHHFRSLSLDRALERDAGRRVGGSGGHKGEVGAQRYWNNNSSRGSQHNYTNNNNNNSSSTNGAYFTYHPHVFDAKLDTNYGGSYSTEKPGSYSKVPLVYVFSLITEGVRREGLRVWVKTVRKRWLIICYYYFSWYS